MQPTEQFHDIYDYIFIPFWKTRTFNLTIIILLLIIAGIITYLVIQHIKRKNALKRILTPAEWALQELGLLKPQEYQKKEEFKKFYFAITKIMKAYIKKEYNLDLTEKTDDEMIAYLQERSIIDKNFIANLKTVLESSLLIKFANAQALREQAEKDLSTLISLIQK